MEKIKYFKDFVASINENVINEGIKPFKDVKIGDTAIDYGDEKVKVIAKGNYKDWSKLKKYDTSGAMADAIKDGFDTDDVEMIAVEDSDGETMVYLYDTSGATVKK